jgi:hypothetical protein
LLGDSAADMRVLRLTREEERRLIARIEAVASYAELQHVVGLIASQLGVELHIGPGDNEVRTVRGLHIRMVDRPGLCRKTQQTVPAAVRRCLERNPPIVYAILDAHGLFGSG